MEITTDSLEWTSEDADLWRTFLQTRTGSRLLPKLAEGSPVLLEEGDINRVCIRAGKVLGFQQSIKDLLAMARPVDNTPTTSEVAYPVLTDDSKWEDGQKFHETPKQ